LEEKEEDDDDVGRLEDETIGRETEREERTKESKKDRR
jgi:hypothetical protein